MKAVDALAVLAEGRPLAGANIEETLCLHELAIKDTINRRIRVLYLTSGKFKHANLLNNPLAFLS